MNLLLGGLGELLERGTGGKLALASRLLTLFRTGESLGGLNGENAAGDPQFELGQSGVRLDGPCEHDVTHGLPRGLAAEPPVHLSEGEMHAILEERTGLKELLSFELEQASDLLDVPERVNEPG